MTDEDFLKALAPEINPDRALLEALARYREAVAQRMGVNMGMVSSRAKGRMLTLTKIAPGEEPVQIIGFDPAVDRDKTVFRTGVVLLKKMGYLSENGEAK